MGMLIDLNFVQSGASWMSQPVQMTGQNASVMIEGNGEMSVEQSVDGSNYSVVEDFKHQFSGVSHCSVIGGLNGLYIRFKSTVKPIKAKLLL